MDFDADVAIVGAGVSGCHLARHLNAKAIIFDPGDVFLKDSGSVSDRIFDFYPDVRVKKKINKILIVGERSSVELRRKRPFAYIIDRVAFWRKLRRGLEINREFVISVKERKKYAVVKTDKGRYRVRAVVGADGALSRVRKSIGARSSIYFGIFGFSEPMYDGYKVHFNKSFGNGFAWQIPDGEYGLISSRNARKFYERFKKQLGVETDYDRAYPISVGFHRIHSTRTVLIGDAASQVKPITFGGIVYSLTSAEMAAIHIEKFLSNEKYDLGNYEMEWRRYFGAETLVGIAFRKFYSSVPQPFIDFGISASGIFKSRIQAEGFDYDRIFGSLLK